MSTLLNLANKIKKTVESGNDTINVGGFTFNLKEILEKLRSAKNGVISYDLTQHGRNGMVEISVDKLMELKEKALSGLPFTYLGEKTQIPFSLGGNWSKVLSIVKYLVIAGLIFYLVYLLKKGFSFVAKPVKDVIEHFTPDIRSDEEIRLFKDSKIKQFFSMLNSTHEKESFYSLLKTIDLMPLTNDEYSVGEVPDPKETKKELENILNQVSELIRKKVGNSVKEEIVNEIRKIPQPYISMLANAYIYDALSSYLNMNEKFAKLKTAFGFDQNYYLKNIENKLKGSAWNDAYLKLWKQGIINQKNKVLLELEKRRRLAALDEMLLQKHYAKRGWKTQHPNPDYIEQAAKVLNIELPIDFSREIFSAKSVKHAQQLDKFLTIDARPVFREWFKLSDSYYDTIFPTECPQLARVFKLLTK